VGSIGFKGNNKQILASIEITPKNFNSNSLFKISIPIEILIY
jgi:hypothetical protein